MTAPTQSIIETRRLQMFPVLEPIEIERVRRFGKVRAYAAGEHYVDIVGVASSILAAPTIFSNDPFSSLRRAYRMMPSAAPTWR